MVPRGQPRANVVRLVGLNHSKAQKIWAIGTLMNVFYRAGWKQIAWSGILGDRYILRKWFMLG